MAGVAAADATVEGRVRRGLSTSRVGEYAAPPGKPLSAMTAPFAR
ncbi:MAG: hypothetical protein WB441_00895 [Nocardioidaceae bacterium]